MSSAFQRHRSHSLTELSGDTSGSSELVFGALARMSDVATDPWLVADYPALAESLWARLRQLRNMASPAATSSAPVRLFSRR
jgi:CO/xanthine dehydrogenase FAD-binding subunit